MALPPLSLYASRHAAVIVRLEQLIDAIASLRELPPEGLLQGLTRAERLRYINQPKYEPTEGFRGIQEDLGGLLWILKVAHSQAEVEAKRAVLNLADRWREAQQPLDPTDDWYDEAPEDEEEEEEPVTVTVEVPAVS